MSKIKQLKAIEILDSRGNPTLQVTAITEDGFTGLASVPSGASTGEHEAVELRDNDPKRYGGKGVLNAVNNVNTTLNDLLVGDVVTNQKAIDEKMIAADGTKNKGKLGANAILGVSLACAKAAAEVNSTPLFKQIKQSDIYSLPTPMMNIINGGAHADNSLDFQEFMIRPISPKTFEEKIRCGTEIFHNLKTLLQRAGHITAVGDEGGFAPNLGSDIEALDLIMKAIEVSGFTPGKDVTIALDCAASEFYDKASQNYIEKKLRDSGNPFKARSNKEQVEYLSDLCDKYPIDSIEDGLDENDWEGWKVLTEKLGKKIQLVGDDLFVTNTEYLKKGIDLKVANSILIKVNQIGTLTETLNAIELAQANGYTAVISHRSGETEDTTIADIAVATNAGQIKTGSLSRTDRVAKYNRLLTISETLKSS